MPCQNLMLALVQAKSMSVILIHISSVRAKKLVEEKLEPSLA